jgi:hypothetical protein
MDNSNKENLLTILKQAEHELITTNGLHATDNLQSKEHFQIDFTDAIANIEIVIAFLESGKAIGKIEGLDKGFKYKRIS